MYLAPKKPIPSMQDAYIRRIIPEFTPIPEAELKAEEEENRRRRDLEVSYMEVAPGEHHILIAEYDFDGDDEEAERLIEDGEEIDLDYRVAHPRDCIDLCSDKRDAEACGVNWLIGAVGINDAFGADAGWGNAGVAMPVEPGTWEIEFRAEGFGDDVETSLVFLEDEK